MRDRRPMWHIIRYSATQHRYACNDATLEIRLRRRDVDAISYAHRTSYMTYPDAALRDKRDAIVMEHMTAENAHEFDRCIDAFSHPRYDMVATGEVWDGKDEVKKKLLQNINAFPDFHFEAQLLQHADSAVIVEGRFRGLRATHSFGERIGLILNHPIAVGRAFFR